MPQDLLNAESIFEQAIEISDARSRDVFIKTQCRQDPALLEEVRTLVVAYEECGSFMDETVRLDPGAFNLQSCVGRQFGDYELLEEIARGGMGVVYKARQVSLNRIVAVKMVLTGQFAGEAELKRFRTEALAAASLTHPNIVAIYEVGECQGQHFYSMPFVEGKSLSEMVESGGWQRGDVARAAALVACLARAVHFAHQSGVLHRDLKPGNILINAAGEPCITDFGLAKRVAEGASLTVAGSVMGTPGYMAPEQARGKGDPTGPATDVYSLGAILYYLLTGRPPFVADSLLDGLMLVLEGEAVLPRRINPQVTTPLQSICMRCLQKKPEHRYASAEELADELERFVRGEPLAEVAPAIGRRMEAWTRNQPALSARFWTVLLCIIIVSVAWELRRYTTPTRHFGVIGVLIFWVIFSYACQIALGNERHARWVRYVWAAVDPLVLTAIIYTVQGFSGPLVMIYPTLIAASGFWLRVPLVFTTSLSCLGGYLLLLMASGPRELITIPSHWHIIVIIAMVVSGLAVSYMVNRANALARFYEKRRPTLKG